MTLSLPEFLRGSWTVTRQIEDRRSPRPASFAGTARFDGDGPDLHYRETGHLEMDGTTLQAERAYLWSCTTDSAMVRFPDGRLFHRFTLADPNAEHLCGDDHYTLAYRFEAQSWQSVCIVRGPKKDYTLTTDYRRED